MNKELELDTALENILNCYICYDQKANKWIQVKNEFPFSASIITSAFGVLKVTKKKSVDVGAICVLNFKEYNQYVKEINGTPTLTRKEYDLLKGFYGN